MPRVVIACLLVLFAIFALLASPVFKIKTVSIQSEACTIDADNIKGRNILLASKDSLAKDLKEKNSCLEDVKVSKKLPSEIKIKAEIAPVVAKLGDSNLYILE